MELSVIIVLTIALGFMSIIAYKMVNNYIRLEVLRNDKSTEAKNAQLIYETEIHKLNQSNKNYKNKNRRLRENYDIEYDDIDYDEESDDKSEFKLSQLAQSIYPKLPPSLAKIIDRDEFQSAIIKTIEKKPDILNTFIDKFINKSDNNTNQQTNKLIESYL